MQITQYEGSGWQFARIGLIVTGEGEEEFLPSLFRPLMDTGLCHFEVIRRIGQRTNVTSPKRLKMTGTKQSLPDRDVTEIGLPARIYLQRHMPRGPAFVVLVDDLEVARRTVWKQVFQRYREVLDQILGTLKHLASVHFLVNMLEAYYFADARAINVVLGTSLSDATGDVEEIGHPKGELKALFSGFDEKHHGQQIMLSINVEHVLSRPETCASLRTLYVWCALAIRLPIDERFCLDHGCVSVVTGRQRPFP